MTYWNDLSTDVRRGYGLRRAAQAAALMKLRFAARGAIAAVSFVLACSSRDTTGSDTTAPEDADSGADGAAATASGGGTIAGGAGQGGDGVAGAAGCSHCSALLTDPNPGPSTLCSSSIPIYDALRACVCGSSTVPGKCAQQCSQACAGGAGDTMCKSCASQNCAPQLTACAGDT